MTMPGDLKTSQESLQKRLDLLRLKEEEFKRKKSEQNGGDEDSRRERVSSELLRSARDHMELEPLLVPHQRGPQEGSASRPPSQIGGDFFRSGSCSSLKTGFTAEFMQVMYTQSLTKSTKSISSLGTIDASTYSRGIPNKLLRHNSKPDLVSLWWEKCPMLDIQNQGAPKRIGSSCPNLLHQEDSNENC